MSQGSSDKYSAKETQKRFEAALRGARIAGHKQMKDVSKKQEIVSVKKKPGK